MQTKILITLLFTILLSGCGSEAADAPSQASAPIPTATVPAEPGSCGLGLVADVSPEDAIRATLAAEGQFVVQQNIDPLMALWAEDSQIIDAKNTPDDAGDDQTWNGRDAIRNRYVRVVFPGAPASIEPADLEIAIDGDLSVVTATTQIGSEISPAGDRWQLQNEGGCWLISSLTYNLEGS